MAPVAVPVSDLESTSQLTKAGVQKIVKETVANPKPEIADLDASKLVIIPNPSPKVVPPDDHPDLPMQNTATDHMLTCQWTEEVGWETPYIRPYGPLELMPTASCLHYATECFEGMKLYRGHDGKLRLFRPDLNSKRLFKSASRIALPAFPPEEFVKLLLKFAGYDAPKWLPDGENGERGRLLYIRPTIIANAPGLGVERPKAALLYIIMILQPPLGAALPAKNPTANGAAVTTPVKASHGLKLFASSHDTIRAWPGGFGYAKVGANYGPTLLSQGQARALGYNQILWLFGSDNLVTEAGASNFFVLWKIAANELELVTAPLNEGLVLEGVTRASVLELVRTQHPEIKISERNIRMQEIVEASEQNRLVEAFVAGTSWFITPCTEIHFRGSNIVLPLGKGVEAAFSAEIKKKMSDIMYGNVQHPWGLVIEESKH